jgi:hypothetical protein
MCLTNEIVGWTCNDVTLSVTYQILFDQLNYILLLQGSCYLVEPNIGSL